MGLCFVGGYGGCPVLSGKKRERGVGRFWSRRNMVYRKRKTIGIIIICVIILSLTGCAETQKQEEPAKLTICTERLYQEQIESFVKVWEKMNDGVDIEVLAIAPDVSSGEAQITKLRTEIMSGSGPDIFILSCSGQVLEEGPLPLFTDPEKAMRAEVFLPLDDYIANAQYINPDGWNQKVMDAGKTEEGQLILPIAYTYYAYAFRTEDLDDGRKLPETLTELFQCYETAVMQNLLPFDQIWFCHTFGKTADYANGTLAFTEDELLERMEQAVEWAAKIQTEEQQETVPIIAGGEVGKTFWSEVSRNAAEEEAILVIPNDEDGVTACVNLYAAVNRNTSAPEQAFSFLDFIFSDEIMTGAGILDESSGKYFLAGNSLPLLSGISVNTKAMQEIVKNQEAKGWYEKIENKINNVRFYSMADHEMADLHMNCADLYNKQLTGDNMYEAVSRTYEKIEMQMAE